MQSTGSDEAVTAIIVTYRTPALTQQAVASCLAAGLDVVLVDNGADGAKALAMSPIASQRLTVMASAANVGFATAANVGAHLAKTGTLLFLNSDASLSLGAGWRLGEEAAMFGGSTLVGPRLLSPEGTVQRSAGLLPRPGDLAIRALGLHHVGRWLERLPLVGRLIGRLPYAREHASAETATTTIDTNMVSGACFAIGREAFWELGGFDERFFMYFEDADLCRRAAAAGMPIRYVPEAVVTHIGGASSSEDYHFGPLHARSMRQYLGKWYGPGGSALALLLLWLRAVGFTLALRPAARRAWRAWWAAVRDEDPRR